MLFFDVAKHLVIVFFKVMLLAAAWLFLLPLGIRSHYEPDIWPGGIVKYHFDKSFSSENKTFIEDVIKKLGQKLDGCIEFKHSKSGHYIHVDTDGCAVDIGYQGPGNSNELNPEEKPQIISLDPSQCLSEASGFEGRVEEYLFLAIGVDNELVEGPEIETAKKMYNCTV